MLPAFPSTHVSDDFDQVVGCAAGVADALHSRQEVRRRVTQQHTHLVGLTSDKCGETTRRRHHQPRSAILDSHLNNTAKTGR